MRGARLHTGPKRLVAPPCRAARNRENPVADKIPNDPLNVVENFLDKPYTVQRLVERPVERIVDKPVTLEREIER